MKSWKLDGGANEGGWINLDTKDGCDDLANSKSKTYEITKNKGSYNYFKLYMTNQTNEDWSMRIRHFELFGVLGKLCICTQETKTFILNPLFLTFISLHP